VNGSPRRLVTTSCGQDQGEDATGHPASVISWTMSSERFHPVDYADQLATSGRITRRDAIVLGLCLCCVSRPGFASQDAALKELGGGLFVREAPHEEASPVNWGGIANIGFIVGRDSVLVTDPGGSLADGNWLRARIRERTRKPILHVVLTHVHPDHCFGAAAFIGDQPEFLGHHRLRAALEARGDYYRERLVEVLGAQDVGEVVYPTRSIEEVAEIDLGDRRLRLTAHATAHTDCDLSMLDLSTGTLFPADLLFVDRIPSLDGSVTGWLAEAEKLKGLGAARAVPGHGPALVDFDQAMDRQVAYLAALRDGARRAIAKGLSIDAASREVALEEAEGWEMSADYHGRNVIQAYKELEWE